MSPSFYLHTPISFGHTLSLWPSDAFTQLSSWSSVCQTVVKQNSPPLQVYSSDVVNTAYACNDTLKADRHYLRRKWPKVRASVIWSNNTHLVANIIWKLAKLQYFPFSVLSSCLSHVATSNQLIWQAFMPDVLPWRNGIQCTAYCEWDWQRG